MQKSWDNHYRAKCVAPDAISHKVAEIRETGARIATLNGSFDLLHAGHLHMLFEAKQAADVLIVALNTDRSIQEYKSKKRPIIPLQFRLQMIAALEFVDFVTWFDETDPRTLLASIKPDVHVNGAEYGEDCIEAETVKQHGGKVKIVTLVPGLSTTGIVEKIKQL